MPGHLRFLLVWIIVSAGVASGVSVMPLRAADDIRYIEPADDGGSSAAVVVPDVPLIHTLQILPLDKTGRLIGKGRASAQIVYVIGELERMLHLGHDEPPQLVKLNVVAANENVVDKVRIILSATFDGKKSKPPAVSYVVGKLRHPDALVAMDAVAVHPESKSFIGPMTAVDDAEREIATFFKDHSAVPPLVFVEWTTEPSIEIELIAARKNAAGPADDSVEFITPPGMTASPVFSRVARVAAGPTIYISDLYADSQADAEAETREIFAHLGKLLDKSGSDFRHLAKATYYVSTNEASTKLGAIRPEFYDPQRPPAASKAPVAGTGREGRTISLDMIAVPRPK